MKKEIEKLISDWEIEIANCDEIINHGTVTQKTLNFTEGEKYAISECLADLKKLNEAIVSEAEFCVVCDEKISTHPVCIHCLVENKFNDKQN